MIAIKKPEWPFYPAWVFLTMLCVPIAFFVDLFILKIITMIVGDFIYVNGVQRITEDYLSMYAFVPLVGVLTGLVQYALLRPHLPSIGEWVWATTGGWVLGALLILAPGWLNLWTQEPMDIDWAFIVMGSSIGAAQWLLLRHRLPGAGWWVGANVLGWALLGLITGDSLNQYGLLALGFLPACATAAILALLFNRAQAVEAPGT